MTVPEVKGPLGKVQLERRDIRHCRNVIKAFLGTLAKGALNHGNIMNNMA
jgi:hypothetical protein